MDRTIETGRKEPLNESRKLALQAKGLFIDVSMTNPASAIGQAAKIAQRCNVLGISPMSLGESLLSQADLIKEIRNVGNERHLKTGANRSNPLSLEEVERVIGADFEMAENLIKLTDEQLREIYSASDDKPTTGEQEEQLASKAEEWLESLGVEFIYLSPPDEGENYR